MQFCSLMKRALSLLLILTVLLGILPAGAVTAEEATTALQSSETLAAAFESLSAPTGALRYGNELVDLTGYRTDSNSHTALDFLTGRYYIVAEVEGKYYFFNGSTTPSDGVVKGYERSMDGNSLSDQHGALSKERTVIFHYRQTNSNNDSEYVLRLGKGVYLYGIHNGEVKIQTSDKWINHTGWIWSGDERKVIINTYTNKQRYCITFDPVAKTFCWQTTTDSEAHGEGTDLTRFLLFRYCYRLDELYQAMETMKTATRSSILLRCAARSFFTTSPSCARRIRRRMR